MENIENNLTFTPYQVDIIARSLRKALACAIRTYQEDELRYPQFESVNTLSQVEAALADLCLLAEARQHVIKAYLEARLELKRQEAEQAAADSSQVLEEVGTRNGVTLYELK